MDKRIGMDALEGAGRVKGLIRVPANRLGGSEHQGRPYPLAASEQAVVHGPVEVLRVLLLAVEELLEPPVDQFDLAGKV